MIATLYRASVGLSWICCIKSARLLDRDDTRLGFGPRPMDVSVGLAVNLPAAQTGITAIGRQTVNLNGLLAVESFGQRPRKQFQFVKLVAGEKIGVTKTRSPRASDRCRS